MEDGGIRFVSDRKAEGAARRPRDMANITVQDTMLVTTKTMLVTNKTTKDSKRTKVANHAGNIMAIENVALVKHNYGDWKTKAKMGVDEVNLGTVSWCSLNEACVRRDTDLVLTELHVPTVSIIVSEAQDGHENEEQKHAKDTSKELEFDRGQRHAQRPDGQLAAEIGDGDPYPEE